MKLNDFFQAQKNNILTDVDKLELYQKFLYKKTARSPIKRFSFVHAKSFAYTVVAAFLIIGVYGVYLFNGSTDNSWFAVNPNTNTVQADYIAKVIDFNGNFSIEHQGTLLQTENIGNGDTILLKEGSSMVFEIDSGTKSKILGPAKLTLQEISNPNSSPKYKINMIYGDFIEMNSNQNSQNIELAMGDITIKQADKNKPINYQFINEGKNHILKNNGSNLIVTKNGNSKSTELSNKEVLAIQNSDVTLFKNWEKFTVAMQKGEVSQTFALSTAKYTDIKTTVSDTNTGDRDEEAPVSLLSLLSPEMTTTVIEDKDTTSISKDIDALMSDTKKIPSVEQTKTLQSTLSPNFLMEDFEKAYIGYVGGDQDAYTASIGKIRGEIQQIFKSLGLTYNSQGTLSENIKTLIATLQSDFEVPPSYIATLSKINNWTAFINQTAKTKTTEDATTQRNELQNNLPNNLKF